MILTVVASLLTACGGDKPAVSAGLPAGASTAPVLRPPSPSELACPRDGAWKACLLEDRMVNAGVGFRAAGDSLRVPFLSVPGARYRIGRTTVLLAFFYPDSTRIRGELAELDTARLVPKDDTVSPWPGAPTLIRSANLVAVLFSASPTQTERIMLAITAGPPQPTSPAR